MKLSLIVASVHVDDDLADAVLLAAEDLAWRDHAEIHVVEAWPRLAPTGGGALTAPIGPIGEITPELIAADRAGKAAALEKLTRLSMGIKGVNAIRMLDGEPGDQVPAYAKEHNADVIVTGTHQRGFWGSLFAGAASRDLVRESPCGVFLVTQPYAAKLRLRNKL